MQLFNYKISVGLNLLLLFALILVSSLFAACKKEGVIPSQEETAGTSTELTGYPNSLLEGTIVSFNLEEPVSMIIEVDVSKVIPESEKMEKTIKIEDDTELIFHNLSTEENREMELSELKPGDIVVVATKESTQPEVLTKDTFTAVKITKIGVPEWNPLGEEDKSSS